MPLEFTFSAYMSQPIRREFALVIVTYGKDNGDSFLSEYFACIHSDHPTKFARRYFYGNTRTLESQLEYTPEVIRENTLTSAQLELDGYILQKYDTTHDTYYTNKSFQLQKIPDQRLVDLAVQNFFREEFNFVIAKSKCASLGSYLERALKIPPIVGQDLTV